MKFPKELTTVTPFSKILAGILFIALPFVGFFIGSNYQQAIISQSELAKLETANYAIPTPSSGCYYQEAPEATCPMKDCGKILICPTPAADEIANWKTYTNADIGYFIKYPESIDTTYYRSNVGSFVSISLPSLNTKDVSENNMTILDSTNSYEAFKEAVDNHVNQTKNNAKINRSPYILDGITGELLIETYPIGVEHQSVWIQYKKTILIFQVKYKPENKEKTLIYFDQILSTFQFTN